MADLQGIAENVIKGNAPEVERLVREAIDEGVDASDILNKGLVAGMDVVGDKFKRNEFYVPEVFALTEAGLHE